jgi:hypothetical protein
MSSGGHKALILARAVGNRGECHCSVASPEAWPAILAELKASGLPFAFVESKKRVSILALEPYTGSAPENGDAAACEALRELVENVKGKFSVRGCNPSGGTTQARVPRLQARTTRRRLARHGPLSIRAAARFGPQPITAGEDGGGTRTVTIVAYTSDKLRHQKKNGWPHPVVVDLQGMDVAGGRVPLNFNHVGPEIGRATNISMAGTKLKARGELDCSNLRVAYIAKLADEGKKWEASIEADVKAREFVKRGKRVVVNGKAHIGPLFVASRSTLTAIALVHRSDDRGTSVEVA